MAHQLWTTSLVLLTTLAITSAYEGCQIRYGKRGCYHKVLEGVLVTCDGLNKETTVPQNLPPDTVYVSLINFNLGQIVRDDFVNFKAVECLTVMDSGVGSVDYDAFAEMEKLAELVLDNTYMNSSDISFVGHPMFHAHLLSITHSPRLHRFDLPPSKSLHKLRTLNLNDNQLDKINPELYVELKNVEELDLSDNRLRTIDWKYLPAMEKLNQLLLHGNRIQTIPEEMHDVFYAVKELSLSGNPLHCNCKLLWLKRFYRHAIDKTLDYETVQCASPGNQTRMIHRGADQFTCDGPTKPVIKFIELDDGRFEINCTSMGDPAPQLTLTLPDGRKVITPPSVDLSKLDTATPQILTRGGPVTCEATNTEGTSTNTEPLPLDDASSAARHLLHLTVLLLAAMLTYIR